MASKQPIRRTTPTARPRQQAAPPEFVAFFRAQYPKLKMTAMSLGASPEEADEAAASAMKEVYLRWDHIEAPLAYGKRAALSNFLKAKERDRNRQRAEQDAEAHRDRIIDHAGLNVWEDEQWVTQILGSLPAAQREALALVFDDFGPTEIARLLGKTPEAIRQNLRAARERLKMTLLDQDRVTQRPSLPAEPATEGGP